MCGPSERVQIFSSERASKLSFKALSSRRSGLTQTFVESCLDFEVAHLSVLMVQRLPYPEIPTLRSDCSHSYWRLDFHISISQHTREGISCAEAILELICISITEAWNGMESLEYDELIMQSLSNLGVVIQGGHN